MAEPIRESGPHLAAVLGTRLEGDGPLYRQLADALKRAIDRGAIPLGTVLPPERSLAVSLSVSRATVVAAYDRLKAEGWLESRQGSGTWVRRPRDRGARVDAVATARLFLAPDAPGVAGPGDDARDDGTVDLAVAALPAAPQVRRALAGLDVDLVDELAQHHGYVPQGLARLREAVAERLTDLGIPTGADQVIVTTGAHQAISLVARQVLEPGASVLVESPTYPGALDVFRRFGARAVPVPVDAEGMRTDLVAELAQRTGASALFVTPHFHNPTGAVLPQERRETLIEAADRARLVVIEDQAMIDLDLDGGPLPPPLAALDPERVHVVGSTSKLFWAGMRIGWLRAPDEWSLRMIATKTVADLGTPLVSQLVASRLLDDLEEVRAERAAELGPRRDLLLRLIAERLPGWTATRPRGGLSVWAELPSGNSVEFAELAARFGVSFVPGPALSVDEGNRRALRLVHARPEDQLVEGIDRLAAAWNAYAPDAARSTARLLV